MSVPRRGNRRARGELASRPRRRTLPQPTAQYTTDAIQQRRYHAMKGLMPKRIATVQPRVTRPERKQDREALRGMLYVTLERQRLRHGQGLVVWTGDP